MESKPASQESVRRASTTREQDIAEQTAYGCQSRGSRGTCHPKHRVPSTLIKPVLRTRAQALFVKTVGPVKEAFVVYNNQANSKGMAVVTFQRSEDAMVARKKFNGKIIDGSELSYSRDIFS